MNNTNMSDKDHLQIDFDADMNRFYIPVGANYEIQTKGKGSSFRIANTETHERHLVNDSMGYVHEMLEDMARGVNAELRQNLSVIANMQKTIDEQKAVIEFVAKAERVTCTCKYLVQVIDENGKFHTAYFKQPPSGGVPEPLYENKLEAFKAAISMAKASVALSSPVGK